VRPLHAILRMNVQPSEGVALYTDGSAYNKDRSGGWAYVASTPSTARLRGWGSVLRHHQQPHGDAGRRSRASSSSRRLRSVRRPGALGLRVRRPGRLGPDAQARNVNNDLWDVLTSPSLCMS
jgi:hypothetical protein